MSARPQAALLPLVALAAALALAGCGAARQPLPRAAKRAPAQKACITQTPVTQSPSGQVSGCLLIGLLGAGRYTAEIDDGLDSASYYSIMRAKLREVAKAAGRKAVPPQLVRMLRQARAPQPPVTVTLSPASGPPGTRVRVTGRLGRAVAHRSGQLEICWDGCLTGLDLGGAAHVRWTSSRTFVTEVSVPDAPWLEGDADRVVPLTSGSYPVSVTCVTGAAGCSQPVKPEGGASFRLVDAHAPRWCRRQSACATLSISRRSVPPGTLVRLSGYVPLVTFDAVGNVGLFAGTVNILSGSHSGPEVSLTRQGTEVSATFGHAALRVVGGAQLASVGSLQGAGLAHNRVTPIAADPADPRIVAWCETNSIVLADGGRRVTVPTASAAPVLKGEGMYQPGEPLQSGCEDVLPLGRRTLLAAFQGQTGNSTGIFADYPVQTDNGGRTWTALPVPAGAAITTFGGFRAAGRGAQALFAAALAEGQLGQLPDPARPLVELTTDAARSWSPSRLRCPSHGPCLTFGPFDPGNCDMGISTQDVLRSTDGGRTWQPAPTLTPGQLACGEGTLVTLGHGTALLVDALSQYPVQVTRDGGARWQNLGLPTPQGVQTPNGLSGLNLFAPAGITVLPDGALLLSGQTRSAQLLEPGARSWCAATGLSAGLQIGQQATALAAIGSRLWWLTYGSAPGGLVQPLRLHTRPLGAIRCG